MSRKKKKAQHISSQLQVRSIAKLNKRIEEEKQQYPDPEPNDMSVFNMATSASGWGTGPEHPIDGDTMEERKKKMEEQFKNEDTQQSR